MQEIKEAYERIAPHIHKTPLKKSFVFSNKQTEVYLKKENEQLTGSFKVRGAFNKILSLPKGDKRLLIASSSGNHAQAVSYVGQKFSKEVFIVMPENTPYFKVKQTESFGAKTYLYGKVYDEAYKKALELKGEKKAIFIPPYEDEAIIHGQASIGLELMDQMRELDSIIVPLGGGGLISGICLAVKNINPKCRIYGVVSKYYSSMKKLFSSEKQKSFKTQNTLADGIAIKQPSKRIYETYIQKYVEDIRDVSDESVASSMNELLEKEKTLVEGAGAVSLAAFKQASNFSWNLGKKTCLLLSGGNLDLSSLSKVIEKSLFQSNRITSICVIADDHPGTLSQITDVIAQNKGNILEVRHERYLYQLDLHKTKIDILMESYGVDHLDSIKDKIKKLGFRLQ